MSDGALFGFDSAFLRRLEKVALISKRPLVGSSVGPRRSLRYGSSPEFADFRDYSPGDDLRRVDWNAYARLDRLFLRLYHAEGIATLTIFLDRSRSMESGEPMKAPTAARLAAIFSYLALYGHDWVSVAAWSDSVSRYLPPQSGIGAVNRVWRFIDAAMAEPSGSTDFAALSREGPFRRRTGLAIVISDFLSHTDWRSGLLALGAIGQEVTAIQVLSPDEIAPSLRGDWDLRDVETGQGIEVTASPRLMHRYQDALALHLQEIRNFCRRQGFRYVLLPSGIPIDAGLLATLQGAGVIA